MHHQIKTVFTIRSQGSLAKDFQRLYVVSVNRETPP
jgi:hypothetical protein